MNSYKQSLFTGIIRICANLLMVGSVFLAMYAASRHVAWPSEATFCLFFFGITIPVWTVAWLLTKWVRRVWPAEQESLVNLPRLGHTLVRWSVVNPGDRKRAPAL